MAFGSTGARELSGLGSDPRGWWAVGCPRQGSWKGQCLDRGIWWLAVGLSFVQPWGWEGREKGDRLPGQEAARRGAVECAGLCKQGTAAGGMKRWD